MPGTTPVPTVLQRLLSPDRRVVFIRSGWAEHYDRTKDRKHPRGGGSHNLTSQGAECDNFRRHGQMYYVYGGSNKIHPVDVQRLGACRGDAAVEHVTVVQVARRPEGGQVVVGWFRGTTAFSEFQDDPNGRPYAFAAPVEGARLLPSELRTITVPKRKGAMGQSHVCYSEDGDGTLRPWVVDVLMDIRYLESGACRSADEVDTDGQTDCEEGAVSRVLVNRYERDPGARRMCIAAHGARCIICLLDLGQVYPDIGDDFIIVHHLVPISTIRLSYRLDPVKDLIPVCPNCHAMLHRRTPEPYTPDELRAALRRGRRKSNAIRLLR